MFQLAIKRYNKDSIILDCTSVIYGTSGGHIKRYRKGAEPEVLTMSDKHDMSVLALEITQEGVVISG